MLNFKDIKLAVEGQLNAMILNYPKLYVVNVDKDTLWETYINAFALKDNPIFRTNTVHDCSCCRSFIKNAGGLVAIDEDDNLITIWDVDVPGGYNQVVSAMRDLVKTSKVVSIYGTKEYTFGKNYNFDTYDETIKWEHFYVEFYGCFDLPPDTIAARNSSKAVLARAIDELTIPALDTILELISSKALYRGESYETSVKEIKSIIEASNYTHSIDNFSWRMSSKCPEVSGFRNTAIGTLAIDLSNEVPLEEAVRSFEHKVAPSNYRRPTALVTPSMVAKAEKKITELGLLDSLPRRFAVRDDINIADNIYSDYSLLKPNSIFKDVYNEAISDFTKVIKNATEVPYEEFLTKIVPTCSKIEVVFEGRLDNNIVSLVAPVNKEAPSLLSWKNGISWSYKNEVTDSIKENVVKAGGKVKGVLRFSIQWNDKGDNNIDFDAHCVAPMEHIYYLNTSGRQKYRVLDIDITTPGKDVAVENIIYLSYKDLSCGDYKFTVKNYNTRKSNGGFSAELEFNGETYSYKYLKDLRGEEFIHVALVTFKDNTLKLDESYGLRPTKTTGQVKLYPVSLITYSPNYWGNHKTGTKHVFFILDDFINTSPVRGFYNEFLRNDLRKDRKTLEILSSKMKVEPSDKQLSGVGFSVSQRNYLYIKTKGKFNRIYKVIF